jgi:hypothetical protein
LWGRGKYGKRNQEREEKYERKDIGITGIERVGASNKDKKGVGAKMARILREVKYLILGGRCHLLEKSYWNGVHCRGALASRHRPSGEGLRAQILRRASGSAMSGSSSASSFHMV